MNKVLKKEASFKTDYSLKDGQKEPEEISRIRTSYREFDPKGNVVLDMVYNTDDGSQDSKMEFVRDGDKVLEEKFFSSEDQPDEHKIHHYEGNRKIKTVTIYADGLKDTTTYEYDEQENLIGQIVVDEDQEEEEKVVYTRDDNGRITCKQFFEDGNMDEPARIEKNVYDQEGQLIEKHIKEQLSEYEEYQVIERDERGREMVVKSYVNDKLVQKNTYTRDEQGNAVEIIEEKPGKRLTIRQTFDDKNQVTGQEFRDINGNLIYTINRTFDDQGNLKESRVQQGEAFFGGKNMYTLTVEHEFYE